MSEKKQTLCPACGEGVACSYQIIDKEGEQTSWCMCVCGTIFHQGEVDMSIYQNGYAGKYADTKFIDDRFTHIERCYFPLIEEMTMGRKFLDVGYTLDNHIQNLQKRGWIATGIEVFDNPYIVGDFETHDFGKQKFDCIKLGHVFEIFKNPVGALYKAASLLNKRGVLLIMAVDGEAMWHTGMQRFGHWSPKEKWFFPSERQFLKIAQTFQLDAVLHRKNFSRRFLEWNDFHVILQKNTE